MDKNQKQKSFAKSISVVSQIASRKARASRKPAQRDAFSMASNILSHLSRYVYRPGQHFHFNEEAPREFAENILPFTGADGSIIPSFPKLRNPRFMPDFNPEEDKYRSSERWLKFISETIKKRDPLSFEHYFQSSASGFELAAEMLGEMFAKREYQVDLVPSDQIPAIYAEEHFGSCMHDPNEYSGAEALGFYTVLADAGHVKMVTLRDQENGKLLARAFVWTALRLADNETVTLLDRIYPGGDSAPHIRFMIEYCQEHFGIVEHKSEQTVDGVFTGKYAIKDTPQQDSYPYLDSFKWAYLDGDTVHLYTDTTTAETAPKMAQLRYTNGEPRRGSRAWSRNPHAARVPGAVDDVLWCDGCDNEAEELYRVFRNDRPSSGTEICEGCRDDSYTYISGEQGPNAWANGEWVHTDYVTYDDYAEAYILERSAVSLVDGSHTHASHPDLITTVGLDRAMPGSSYVFHYQGAYYTVGDLVRRKTAEELRGILDDPEITEMSYPFRISIEDHYLRLEREAARLREREEYRLASLAIPPTTPSDAANPYAGLRLLVSTAAATDQWTTQDYQGGRRLSQNVREYSVQTPEGVHVRHSSFTPVSALVDERIAADEAYAQHMAALSNATHHLVVSAPPTGVPETLADALALTEANGNWQDETDQEMPF